MKVLLSVFIVQCIAVMRTCGHSLMSCACNTAYNQCVWGEVSQSQSV